MELLSSPIHHYDGNSLENRQHSHHTLTASPQISPRESYYKHPLLAQTTRILDLLAHSRIFAASCDRAQPPLLLGTLHAVANSNIIEGAPRVLLYCYTLFHSRGVFVPFADSTMATQVAMFAETIAGMKRAVKRKSYGRPLSAAHRNLKY